LSGLITSTENKFDRTNAIIAGLVFLGSFIVYALTVQRSVPFWDCGEFIACSVILGVPHPPGTPLMVLIGRLFSLLPIFADMAHRVNFISVIASAMTAMLAYLLTVKIVSYFFDGDNQSPLSRFISYAGGIAGGLFTAFGQTNWDNSVEAEVYAVSMSIAIMLVYITIRYFETKGTFTSTRLMVMYFYLAVLGIGFALMGYLVVPVCAIAFILKKDAETRDWVILCSCLIAELALIILFSNGRGGVGAFYIATAFILLGLLWKLYQKINWIIVFAIICVSSTIIAFDYFLLSVPIAFGILLILGLAHVGWSNAIRYGALLPIALACTCTIGFKYGTMPYVLASVVLFLVGASVIATSAREKRLSIHWRSAAAILAVAIIGFSVHLYLPIRSTQQPRINENNPSRSYRTFVNFLDRKQYGSESMVDRMFQRRGTWENQFGWHPNMGFWSYFEGQWSKEGVTFIPWFLLGVIGIGMAIKKKVEVGMPFLTIFLLCSVGLILYMNFADGTKYNYQTGDAYLEVRDRDYFFTAAFVFFSIAMGIGVSAVLQLIRTWLAKRDLAMAGKVVYGLGVVLICLPGVALATNWHENDRSDNRLAYQYAKAILDSCDQNAILFTSGDNDTFPVWALQEAYGYRQDVRIVNLSLLNTDWYVYQMKQQYNVPISLTKEQILWNQFEVPGQGEYTRPDSSFIDRPRRREAYLVPSMNAGHVVKVQDMMVDEIVLENKWKDPIFFSSPPYAESPLKLRDHATAVGMVFRLDRDDASATVDLDKSVNLYMNTYTFNGLENSKIYRDENATGIFVGEGLPTSRLWDELGKRGQVDKGIALMNHLIQVYPEYWQSYSLLADYYEKQKDSAKGLALWQQVHDTLDAFHKSNESNLLYLQDLGLCKVELGKRKNDQALIDAGIMCLKNAFEANRNSSFAFRKYVSVLYSQRRFSDAQTAARQFTEYKINLGDPYAQQLLGIQGMPNMQDEGQ
jgi:hypothetical protein